MTRHVFIVGAPRSGTKLLRQLLNRHSRIAIPENETDIYPALLKFFAKEGPDVQEDWFERLTASVGHTKFFVRRAQSGNPIDFNDWKARIIDPSPPSTLSALISMVAGTGGTSVDFVGDKSPLHLLCVGELLRDFPDSRVVHIVRDGREAAISASFAWGKEPLRAIQKWSDTTQIAHFAGLAFHERYLCVKYEELTDAPEAQLRLLCAFLEVEFEKEMITLTNPAENIGRARGANEVLKPLAQYAESLRPAQLHRMEEIFLPAARVFGYTPLTSVREPRRLRTSEALRASASDALKLLMFHVREMGLVAGTRYVLSRRKLLT